MISALTIAGVPLSSPCLLAPLAGISDLPFRMLNRSLGCGFAFVEMISARALVYRNKSTKNMLSSLPGDRPLGMQLLGDDPEIMRRALDLLDICSYDLIDVNAACPVNKVTARGEGASLLKDPRKLGELLRAVVAHAGIPVTVKIRTGWDESSVNAREVALHARDAGIQCLFIHGRTRAQGYSGKVDYRVIAEVKAALDIPVIASGDGLSPQLIKKMLDETGCDGVAVARGSLGNPWIFRDTEEFLAHGTIPPRPGIHEIAATMARHMDLCADYYGDTVGPIQFRKFFGWYTKKTPGTRALKEKAFRAATRQQMLRIIEELTEGEKEISPAPLY
jgi:nifR3 family TIM-barrel protein